MGELAQEYEGQVEFVVVSAEQTAQRSDEIELYGFTEKKHGLVGFAPGGEAVVTIPGHDYGKSEIDAAVKTVLAK